MSQMFYAFEGTDGSGKSSMTKYAGNYLTEHGVPNLVVESYPRDPESMFLRDLWIQKKVPDEMILLIVLELRKRILMNQIIPALLSGKIVISDRWHDTTWAYQGDGMGIDASLIEYMMRRFDHGIIPESITPFYRQWLADQIENYTTVFLDVSLETSRLRVGRRSTDKDAFEKDGDEFFLKVAHGFSHRTWHRVRSGNSVIRIDANKSKEEVEAKVRDAFLHFIP